MANLQVVDPKIKFTVPVASIWTHVKRGTSYVVTGLSLRESDMALLVSYRDVSQNHETLPWTRPASEFLDGRFVRKL